MEAAVEVVSLSFIVANRQRVRKPQFLGTVLARRTAVAASAAGENIDENDRAVPIPVRPAPANVRAP